MEDLICPVCFDPYSSSNDPLILPFCGHTVCRECLINILNETNHLCPIDRKPIQIHFNYLSIENWPKNFALMSLIDKKLVKKPKMKLDKCAIHKKSKKFICRSCDNEFLCFKCVMQTAHRHHEIEDLKDCLVKKVNELKEAELRYEQISTKNNEVALKIKILKESLLKNNRIELEAKVDKFFDRLLVQLTDEIEFKRNITKREVTTELWNAIQNIDKEMGYFDINTDLTNFHKDLGSLRDRLYSEKSPGNYNMTHLDKDIAELNHKIERLEHKTDVNIKNNISLHNKKLIHFKFMFDADAVPQVLDKLICINKEDIKNKMNKRGSGSKLIGSNQEIVSSFKKNNVNFYSFVNLARYEDSSNRSDPRLLRVFHHSNIERGNNSGSLVSIPYSEQNEVDDDTSGISN